MKNFFTVDVNQKILRTSAIYGLLWGLVVALFPQGFLRLFGVELFSGVEFWQLLGMGAAVMGVGYFIASFDSDRYWPIVMVGLLSSLLGTFVFAKALVTHIFPAPFSLFMLLSHAIWPLPFYYILLCAYDNEIAEDSEPKKFSDLIKYVRTSQNISLLELSRNHNVLLVFVRHFGCTFCRETVAEMSKIESAINERHLTPVFVHMSDLDFGNEFFARYYQHPVHHVSDPGRALYKSLNLKRGSLYQLFGPMTWIRYIYAGILKGHGVGRLEGDGMQLGGVFVLSQGQILFEEKAKSATHMFHLDTLPKF